MDDVQEKVDLFKQVLIIRSIRPESSFGVHSCSRPDRMITATKGFIAYKLSDYYVQPPSLVYDKIFESLDGNKLFCILKHVDILILMPRTLTLMSMSFNAKSGLSPISS